MCVCECAIVQNTVDTSSGGPTQEELLEQLQKCDISASRVSSAVSSRAPSPSPSLMSIMYPGLKHGVGTTQAGTPTILLRSLGPPPPSNLFKPIRRNSTTGSNLSLSTAAQQVATLPALNVHQDRTDDGGGDRDSDEDAGTLRQPQPIAKNSIVEHSETENEKGSICDDGLTNNAAGLQTGDTDAPECRVRQHRLEKVKLTSGATAGLAHQRTRSNEIDYISRAVVPARIGQSRASLPSPPGAGFGNSRAFRPVSAEGSAHMDSTSFSASFSYTLLQSHDGSGGKNLTGSESSAVHLDSFQVKTGGHIARVSSEGAPLSSSSSSSRVSPAGLDGNLDP